MITPFTENRLFLEACEICEAYTGAEHFYGSCTRCPVYRMAQKLRDTEAELRKLKAEKSWDDFPERMGR